MSPEPEDRQWLHGQLRMAVWIAGALAACGLVGLFLSALGVPDAVTWPVAAGAAVGGGWAADRWRRRREERD